MNLTSCSNSGCAKYSTCTHNVFLEGPTCKTGKYMSSQRIYVSYDKEKKKQQNEDNLTGGLYAHART